LVAPWGEYYARNQRTIPPLLYADMAVQSGVNFDAFGLQFLFGLPTDGMFVRDMFQISACLDQFSKLGKPVHVTGVQAPSDVSVGRSEADAEASDAGAGMWREPWNEQVQAEWLRRFVEVALSKPFVESITWNGLADHARLDVPHGGLVRADLAPKAAYKQLLVLRSELLGTPLRASADSASA